MGCHIITFSHKDIDDTACNSDPWVSNTNVASFIFLCATFHHLNKMKWLGMELKLRIKLHEHKSVWYGIDFLVWVWDIGSGPNFAFSPLAISSFKVSYSRSNFVMWSWMVFIDLGNTASLTLSRKRVPPLPDWVRTSHSLMQSQSHIIQNNNV